MTEPPRPPGADEPGATPPEPTSPPAPTAANPPAGDTAAGSPPPGADAPSYAPPSQPAGGDYPPPGQPAGGYPPPGPAGPGGYPPPGAAYPAGGPTGYPSNDDKTWALVAHFGGAAGMFIGGGCAGWIAPLVALLARGNQSPVVRAHAVAALNFQVLWSIIAVVGWILTCILIGPLIAVAAMIIGIIFGVIAGIKANEGELYRYPMSATFIK